MTAATLQSCSRVDPGVWPLPDGTCHCGGSSPGSLAFHLLPKLEPQIPDSETITPEAPSLAALAENTANEINEVSQSRMCIFLNFSSFGMLASCPWVRSTARLARRDRTLRADAVPFGSPRSSHSFVSQVVCASSGDSLG